MLEDNLDYEMAARGRSRRVRSISLVLIYLFVCIHQGQGHSDKRFITSIYKSADHYWPMKKISDNISRDAVGSTHASIENGAKVNITKHYGPAVILDGRDDCIMLDLEDCTNTPSKCHNGFTITFWFYYVRGEFILCTGSYKNQNKGPGIKLIYDEENKLFTLEISTQNYKWTTVTRMPLATWVHVGFTWTEDEGIKIYNNGKLVPQESIKREAAFDQHEFSHGWSIGRPNDIFKLPNYGHFGISHLALWLRELTVVEVATAYAEMFDPDELIKTIKDQLQFHEQSTTTNVTPKKSRSTASNISTSVGASLLILLSCLL